MTHRFCGFSAFGRQRNIFAGALVALLFTAGLLPAANVSGTYADKGVVVGSAGSAPPETISFHGLLSQQVDPELAALDFDETDRVILEDRGDTLVLEIYNTEDKRLWRSVWDERRGYSKEEGKAVVRMRKRGSSDGRYVLVMEPAEDGKSLIVNVYNVTPTSFGPDSEPIGTYLFVRAD